MNRFNIKYVILLFLFAINVNTMEAQESINSKTALNTHQQTLATIAALTATGNQEELKSALSKGLDAGLVINEIKEALVQLYAYCGFPRSLNALGTFRTVLDEREAKGIKDKEGKAIVVENIVPDKYEQGRKVLEELTRTPQQKPAPGFGEFAPRADAFLKEHLFADIFHSNVLNYRQREFVTISALAAMPGVEPQLKAHIFMGKNTGVTDAQLAELTDVIEKAVGRSQANVLRKAIGQPELPVIQFDMMVRIAEIEVVPEYLEQYNVILKDQSSKSMEIEPGVISIFPMYQKDNPTVCRLIEIYASKNAYDSHIKSEHFQKYKTTTLKMVKSLKLLEMGALNPEAMKLIFEKLK
ncbi:carboxymuconolactone decarboxylase family protein [Pedobacter nutrimenti]|uniref:carboxymuconolactone decarboxylase family protein n=1 Tax=Pedobacter nutrimenti TaxID=1241337 RepID=UPI00292FCB23|nr:carboxymuconolactone decarboxylase family protein [Pedobacter nutrimenti]